MGDTAMNVFKALGLALMTMFLPTVAAAATFPTPKQGVWVAPSFKFHTGEVMANVKLAYTTVGEPTGIPILLLHGTGSSAERMLTPAFAGELFGPGQPLDATKYYIVIPDALGHGRSAKPSDALKAKFPRYNYTDMVDAQYRLVTEGLGIRHLRLVLGSSMGGMLTWEWGERYPDAMDALVPLASQPTAMAGRNWMLRRMLIESVRNDPGYNNGDYTEQPHSMKYADVMFGLATSGGTLNLQKQAPTRALADKIVDARLAAPSRADANDFIWAWGASADYDAAPGLEKIQAHVLAINAADDERNPPETGLVPQAMKRVKHGQLYLIPATAETSGHGTTGNALLYKQQLQTFLDSVPRRGR
jgi:homoserine O-acetyltransferase/O-succinyltransferase